MKQYAFTLFLLLPLLALSSPTEAKNQNEQHCRASFNILHRKFFSLFPQKKSEETMKKITRLSIFLSDHFTKNNNYSNSIKDIENFYIMLSSCFRKSNGDMIDYPSSMKPIISFALRFLSAFDYHNQHSLLSLLGFSEIIVKNIHTISEKEYNTLSSFITEDKLENLWKSMEKKKESDNTIGDSVANIEIWRYFVLLLLARSQKYPFAWNTSLFSSIISNNKSIYPIYMLCRNRSSQSICKKYAQYFDANCQNVILPKRWSKHYWLHLSYLIPHHTRTIKEIKEWIRQKKNIALCNREKKCKDGEIKEDTFSFGRIVGYLTYDALLLYHRSMFWKHKQDRTFLKKWTNIYLLNSLKYTYLKVMSVKKRTKKDHEEIIHLSLPLLCLKEEFINANKKHEITKILNLSPLALFCNEQKEKDITENEKKKSNHKNPHIRLIALLKIVKKTKKNRNVFIEKINKTIEKERIDKYFRCLIKKTMIELKF